MQTCANLQRRALRVSHFNHMPEIQNQPVTMEKVAFLAMIGHLMAQNVKFFLDVGIDSAELKAFENHADFIEAEFPSFEGGLVYKDGSLIYQLSATIHFV